MGSVPRPWVIQQFNKKGDVRDAENAGRDDIAGFFRDVMSEDSARASKCHEFLKELSGSEESGPAVT
jgi:hypothetical protein